LLSSILFRIKKVRNFNKSPMRYLLSLLAFCTLVLNLFGEGSAQLMPVADSYGYLHLSKKAAFTNFGQYGAAPERQIKIKVGAVGETIYWGLNNKLQSGGFVANFPYRILDPSGKPVFTGTMNQTGQGSLANITQAMQGPRQLLGDPTKGYDALSIVAKDTGDYVIEFDMSGQDADEEVQIQLFDITVAGVDKKPVPGRLHSKGWQISTGAANNSLSASVYPIDSKGVVYEVKFDKMEPFTFAINFNSYGTSNTGDPDVDRQSVRTKSLSQAQTPEFDVFLNPPDEKLYPTTVQPVTFKGEVVRRDCQKAEFCLEFTSNSQGFLEGFIDLNGDAEYDSLAGDIYFSDMISQAGKKCVEWNGADAGGNPVTSKDIKVYASIGYNVTHLPLWDVENNANGFKVRTVRPTDLPDPLIYFDDSKVGGGKELAGCNSATQGCHKWTGKGKDNNNSETFNTWWYTVVKYDVLTLSTLPLSKVQLSFNSSGLQTEDKVVCKSDSLDFYVYNDNLSHFDTSAFRYEWYLNSKLSGNDTRNFRGQINAASDIIVRAVSRQNSNCFTADTLKVTTVDPVKISAAVSDISCSNTPGVVEVTVLDGPPSPRFTWKEIPAATTGSVSGLARGTYHLTIADPVFSATCALDTSFEIKGGKPIEISQISVDSSECYTATGAAVVSMKDNGRVYNYTWDSDSPGGSDNKSGLSSGQHRIQVIESVTGCKDDSMFIIPAKPLKAEASAVDEICNDSKGSIKLKLPAGGDFLVTWNNVTNKDTVTTGLSSGVYPVKVQAAGNVACKADLSAEVKNIDRKILPQFILKPVICGKPTGSAEVVMPDNRDYLFKWSSIAAFDKTQKSENLDRGTYPLSIAENGTTCRLDTNFTITGTDSISIKAVKTNPSECYAPTGSATAEMEEPAREYKYTWDNTVSASASASSLSYGSHIIYAEEINTGCKTQQPFQIDQLPLKISASSTGEICRNSMGEISLQLPPADFNVTWNGSAGKDKIKKGLPEGDYLINVVAVINPSCKADTTIKIFNADRTLLISELVTEPALCGKPVGTGTVKMPADSRNYVFEWNSSGGFSSQNKLTGLAKGVYTLSIMETGYLCRKDTNFTVEGTDPIEITGVPVMPSECYKATGAASVEMKDVSRSYEYAWDSFVYDGSVNRSGLKQGSHIIRVREKVSGCTDEENFTISALPLTGSLSSKDELCSDKKGEITVVIPDGDFKIFWTSVASSDRVRRNLSAGTYTVKVVAEMDANCVFEGSEEVKNIERPVIISNISTSPSDCGIPTGSAKITMPSDSRVYVYAWDFKASSELNPATELEVGEHTVTVSEEGTSCKKDTTFRIAGKGFSFGTASTPEICDGFSGTVTVRATGSNLKIRWKDNPSTQFVRENLPSGKYEFSISNNSDVTCKVEGSVIVHDTSYNVPADFSYRSLAYKGRMQAGAVVQFSNTTNADLISSAWTFGDGKFSSDFHGKNQYLHEGDYSVKLEVRDTYGCKGSKLLPLRIDPFIPCGPALPNAFSPNEDNVNDDLSLLGFAESVDLKIFNRWGEVIFRTQDFDNKWKGVYRDSEVPIGVYPFVLQYECSDESGNLIKTETVGEITLVR
jgi:gliding motility-associated-like protein